MLFQCSSQVHRHRDYYRKNSLSVSSIVGSFLIFWPKRYANLWDANCPSPVTVKMRHFVGQPLQLVNVPTSVVMDHHIMCRIYSALSFLFLLFVYSSFLLLLLYFFYFFSFHCPHLENREYYFIVRRLSTLYYSDKSPCKI